MVVTVVTGSRKIVVNIEDPADRILHNPTKGELQAHFDTVAEKHGGELQAHFGETGTVGNPVLRGLVDSEGNHVWGSAHKYNHTHLQDTHPSVTWKNPDHVYAFGNGQIGKKEYDPNMNEGTKITPVQISGIGKLQPAKKFVANALQGTTPAYAAEIASTEVQHRAAAAYHFAEADKAESEGKQRKSEAHSTAGAQHLAAANRPKSWVNSGDSYSIEVGHMNDAAGLSKNARLASTNAHKIGDAKVRRMF